jgi:hypothetical protein
MNPAKSNTDTGRTPKAHALTLIGTHRDALAETARARADGQGRGVVVAVHAGGLLQATLYHAPEVAAEVGPSTPAFIGAVREAVRAYDPEREAVVLVADSLAEAFSCWRVWHPGTEPDGSPPARLVAVSGSEP